MPVGFGGVGASAMCYGGGGLHTWSWREGEVDLWLCNGSCHPWSWREEEFDSLGHVAHPWKSGGAGWLEIWQEVVVGDWSNGEFGGWFSRGRLKGLLKRRFWRPNCWSRPGRGRGRG